MPRKLIAVIAGLGILAATAFAAHQLSQRHPLDRLRSWLASRRADATLIPDDSLEGVPSAFEGPEGRDSAS